MRKRLNDTKALTDESVPRGYVGLLTKSSFIPPMQDPALMKTRDDAKRDLAGSNGLRGAMKALSE